MRENDFIEFDSVNEMDPIEVARAQELVVGFFGTPHPEVIFEGVYFHERRFPFTIYTDPTNPKQVAVCLPQHQANDGLARFFHLTHELVHCLTPNGPQTGQATVLEEGLAEHAKIYLVEEFFQSSYEGVDFRTMTSGSYRAAFDMVEELVAVYGLQEMRQIVTAMRMETLLPFAHIGPVVLRHYFPRCRTELLVALGSPFHKA
ncbi:hypothetical protein [Agrobacterium radiobacter]|uniref:hypothetical protein n=1 Tax=Agrobacterium radiobacter TaxID=362 RepID=UPI000DDAF4CE